MASVRHLGLFPWCLNRYGGNQFFQKLDIAKKAVPMWWRVKEWKLESQFVIQANTSPPVQISNTDEKTFSVTSMTKNLLTEDTYTKEKDLICAGVIYDLEAQQSYRIERDHLFVFSIGELEEGGDGFNEAFLRIGPDFEFRAAADDTGEISTKGENFLVGTLSVNYCGQEWAVEIKSTVPLSPTGQLYQVVSFDAQLTAIQYWPYDPNDGRGPIYDTATGKQLRPFPN